MSFSDFWTTDRLLWLRERWEEGATAGELCREAQVTRNTILGMVHRMQQRGELSRRSAPSMHRRPVYSPPVKREAPAPRQPKPKRAKPDTAPELDPELAARIEDVGMKVCHWPYGDPGAESFRYCGRPGYPYCEGHAGMAYQPAVRRKKSWE